MSRKIWPTDIFRTDIPYETGHLFWNKQNQGDIISFSSLEKGLEWYSEELYIGKINVPEIFNLDEGIRSYGIHRTHEKENHYHGNFDTYAVFVSDIKDSYCIYTVPSNIRALHISLSDDTGNMFIASNALYFKAGAMFKTTTEVEGRLSYLVKRIDDHINPENPKITFLDLGTISTTIDIQDIKYSFSVNYDGTKSRIFAPRRIRSIEKSLPLNKEN